MNKSLFLPVFAALITLYGCGSDDDNLQPKDPDSKSHDVELYCNGIPEEVVLSRTEAPYPIYLDTNIPADSFNISVDMDEAAWCMVEIYKSSDGDNSIVLRVTSQRYDRQDEHGQPLYEPYRTAIIHLSAGSTVNKDIKVVQESNIRLLTDIDYTSLGVLQLSPEGETVEVKVLTNCYSWMCYTQADWLTLEKKDNSTILVTSSPRPSSQTEPREAEITIMSNKFIEGLSPQTDKIIVRDADALISGEEYTYDDEVSEWD